MASLNSLVIAHLRARLDFSLFTGSGRLVQLAICHSCIVMKQCRDGRGKKVIGNEHGSNHGNGRRKMKGTE